MPVAETEKEPLSSDSKKQEHLPVKQGKKEVVAQEENKNENGQGYKNEIVLKVEHLQQEVVRFEKHTQDITKKLESMKGYERVHAAEEYDESLRTLSGKLEDELKRTRESLYKFVMEAKVGQYIDSFKNSFSSSYKGPEAKSPEEQQQEAREQIETAVSTASEGFKMENIPPVNIPAIIALCARIASLEEKITLVGETRVMVSGYKQYEGREKDEIKEQTKKGKEYIGKILFNAEKTPEEIYSYGYEIDKKKEVDMEYYFRTVAAACGELGLDSVKILKAQQYYKIGNFDSMRDELYNLDKDLTEVFNSTK